VSRDLPALVRARARAARVPNANGAHNFPGVMSWGDKIWGREDVASELTLDGRRCLWVMQVCFVLSGAWRCGLWAVATGQCLLVTCWCSAKFRSAQLRVDMNRAPHAFGRVHQWASGQRLKRNSNGQRFLVVLLLGTWLQASGVGKARDRECLLRAMSHVYRSCAPCVKKTSC
jgi:hypothetical protein